MRGKGVRERGATALEKNGMRGGIAQGAMYDGLCLTTLDRRRQGLKGGVSRQATGLDPFFFAGLDPLFLTSCMLLQGTCAIRRRPKRSKTCFSKLKQWRPGGLGELCAPSIIKNRIWPAGYILFSFPEGTTTSSAEGKMVTLSVVPASEGSPSKWMAPSEGRVIVTEEPRR